MRIRNEQLRAVLIVGGSRTERLDRARVWVEHALSENPALVVWRGENPERWPFRPIAVGLPSEATPLVWVNDIEHAFPNHQVGGTRLVLTQSTYVLQKWCDLLATRSGSLFLAVGSENGLERNAPEVFAGRGPWARFTIRRVAPEGDDSTPLPGRGDWGANDPEELLVAAYNQPSPSARIEACRRSVELRPDWPVARLALASALMEQQELDDAREMLDEAVRLAPDCEAVHFERGKLWLRYDDMERASDSFRRAGELMATFSAAFSNLGATLGELDRPEEGLAAFQQALKEDPNNFTILNNVGVVCRELGRLDESEAALRRVTALNPEFIFGHYNLGHTLFLHGKFAEAVEAYAAGQARDPERNARQACRLAMSRLASGDPEGAVAELEGAIAGAAPELKLDLLAHADEILTALLGFDPATRGAERMAAFIRAGVQEVQSELEGSQ